MPRFEQLVIILNSWRQNSSTNSASGFVDDVSQFYTVNTTHCIVRWKTNAMIESYGPQSLAHYRFMMHYSSVGVMVDMHLRTGVKLHFERIKRRELLGFSQGQRNLHAVSWAGIYDYRLSEGTSEKVSRAARSRRQATDKAMVTSMIRLGFDAVRLPVDVRSTTNRNEIV